MPRRNNIILVLVAAIAVFVLVSTLFGSGASSSISSSKDAYKATHASPSSDSTVLDTVELEPMDVDGLGDALTGGAIAPKLGNETLKSVSNPI